MPDFETLLHSIAKRPAMYVGRYSLRSVADYLHGYDHALGDLGHAPTPLEGWRQWIESRFLISSPAWSWTRILLHAHGSDRAAIEALPGLHGQFLSERAALGVAGIEAERLRRLLAEHGKEWHEPPSTVTTADA